MAGEFTKRTVDGQIVWTCITCGEEIVNVTKPRSHQCQHHAGSTGTTPTRGTGTPRTPGTPIRFPPPSYQVPPPLQQLPWDQFMQFQQEQMLVFQQQQTQMMEKQQELILRQQQQQEAQNSLNMNRMMEMLKLQKTNDTKVKCPKWEEEENINNQANICLIHFYKRRG